MSEVAPAASITNRAKELLADPRKRIALDDFVNEHLGAALTALAADHFSVNAGSTNEDFVKRVAAYESAVGDLMDIVILVARWGDAEGRNQLEKIFLRLAETAAPAGGSTTWLYLRWYPVVVLIYVASIAALTARRYDMLAGTFTPIVHFESHASLEALANAAMDPVDHLAENFKALPGLGQKRFPRNEHLFAILRAPLDRLLCLGARYEFLFDRFEVILALAYIDLRDPKGEGDGWAPFGRFVYKLGRSNNPFDMVIQEATAAGNTWPLLATGLFGGQSSRFLKVAGTFRELIKQHGRW